ncbi:hypothetical protein niasHT_000434 [Heterodera trifolii]|uniref:Secreted protein n=1 Tax=Heterodera trifolii TaxID=157864 RepID=A0ABD2M629_9BILA
MSYFSIFCFVFLLLRLNALPTTGDCGDKNGTIRTVRALPPKYLQIRDYRKCTGIKDAGGWASLCLPSRQKAFCPDIAWNALNSLGENDRFPFC